MDVPQEVPLDADTVSYEAPPFAEVQVDDLEYRVDPGLGSVVAISRREVGTSTWTPVAQGRWDGVRLKAKALGYPVTTALERAIAAAMKRRAEELA
jgi:hypothetical protein